MTIVRAPIEERHLETCNEVGALLLAQGLRIERIDAVVLDRLEPDQDESITTIFLHVTAENDIPNADANADDPIDHCAGDCWQEVWHVWRERDATTGKADVRAMRVV